MENPLKLLAILSWFDENPDWLADCVASLALAEVDYLIAVDGRYALFPGEETNSSPLQWTAIMDAAPCPHHILTRSKPWQGNEIEKRTRAFQEAKDQNADWWLVIDADMEITRGAGLKDQLEDTDLDTAESILWDRKDVAPFRNLYRAQSIHLEHNHYTYVTEDGRWLWNGPAAQHDQALPTSMRIKHKALDRTSERIAMNNRYYEARTEQDAERFVLRPA